MKELLQKHFSNFESFGFSRLKPLSFDYYEAWLNQGYQGEMSYLEEHKAAKRDPALLLKSAQSAIVVTKSYVPHPKPKSFPLPIANYAQGLDYHHWFFNELKTVVKALKAEFPDHQFMPFADSMPILERDFAVRAGLGWIGKNACLINESRGSFEFIGGILTSLPLEADLTVAPDRCGTCTRCIDACPTEAILEGRKIDSNKCISYLTIESKSVSPSPLTPKIDSYFGCDICQTVCPWNREVIGTQAQYTQEEFVNELRFLLKASNSQIENHFKGTALTRTTANRHRRNAIVLATNQNLKELIPELEALRMRKSLRELINYSFERLGHTPLPFQEVSLVPHPPEVVAHP